jgi:hypothetical protein
VMRVNPSCGSSPASSSSPSSCTGRRSSTDAWPDKKYDLKFVFY